MKKNQISIFLFLMSFFSVLWAQQKLPLNLAKSDIHLLRTLVNEELEVSLTNALKKDPKMAKLIREKRLAVGLVDLQNPYQVRFARVNGNEMMYAASLPKIAILLAAMDAFQKGELRETKEIRQDLNKMIRHSNNQASTRMIDLLGYEKIEAVLTDPQYELFDEDYGGGLWVGKRYAASGQRNPDPIKGLSHAATVSQVCRFYYLLAMGQLVSQEHSQKMLEIMVAPALHHKFVNTLDQVAPEAKVYRKSGTWKTYHADSALVWGENPRRRYILVALIEHPEGEQITRKLVRIVEKLLDL